jgi:hypothetical protein
MSTTPDFVTETDILNQLTTGEQPGFSREVAQAILNLRFSPAAISRMNELAERNRRGTLSEADQAALEKYLRVAHFLNVVQAQARVCLSAAPGASN